MGQDPSTIREDIEATRGRMGETVDALTEKADATTRTRQRLVAARDDLVSTATATKNDLVGRTREYASNPGRAAQDAKAQARHLWAGAREDPKATASTAGTAAVLVTGFVAMALRARRGRSQHSGRPIRTRRSVGADRGGRVARRGR